MPIAVYARLSPRSDSGESIADQVRDGTLYAGQHWPGEPVEVFEDKKRSGTTMADRPGLAALLDALATGRITQVCIRHQDRLTRGEWTALSAHLLAAGIDRVHTWRGGVVEVESDAAEITDLFAKLEARKIKKNTVAKLTTLRAEGRHLGAVPFGYESVGPKYHRVLKQVPEEAAEVRLMYERITSGWSLAAVCDDLNRRKVPTARGAAWRPANMRKLLDSPKLCGLDSNERPLAAGAVEPILTEDEWRHFQQVLRTKRVIVRMDGQQRIATVKQGQRRAYPLTGLLTCAEGCPMTGHAKTLPTEPPRPTYRCGHSQVPAEPTEKYVIDTYLEAVTTPAFLAALAEDTGAAKRQEIGAKLETLAGQRVALAGNLDLEPDEYAARRDAIRKREAELRAQLANLPPPAGQVDPVVVREAWPYMTPGEQREFLGIWLEKVIVGPAIRTGPRRFDWDRLIKRLTIVWR